MPKQKFLFHTREHLLNLIEKAIKENGEYKVDLSIRELNTALVRATDQDTGEVVRFKIQVTREL